MKGKSQTKPTVDQVARRIHRTVAITTSALKKRINNNAYGYTSAEIYAAMGETAATAVQDHIAKADAAVSALVAAETTAQAAAQSTLAPMPATPTSIATEKDRPSR
jgi:hypothetical protein